MALTVYKASAGSGKTFTLAVEYIKLLIINPYEYKHILAVTFTNKATAEMKSRIISQLNGIARGDKSSDGYVEKIKEYQVIKDLNISDDELRRRAGLALTLMLHDYSRFRIETIDSFFQSVIRELAHELDLTANLRVDLNDNEVLTEAVNSIIDDIEHDSKLFNTIRDFIEDKTENNNNWHINSEVEAFGKNIFNEEYLQKGQEIREKIGDTKFLTKYRKTLKDLIETSTKELEDAGKKFIAIRDKHGYSEDNFKYGKTGIHNFFVKLSNGIVPEVSSRILDCKEDAKQWLKDKNDSNLLNLVISDFKPMLDDIINKLPDLQIKLNSSNAILKHINHMMLLNVINIKVRDLNQDANRFLLADTAHFLNDLIDGSDIPFIYEKMGARFNHIMIDEFQDTSRLQWENFKPLISNSLDSNEDCLIVGDVKQSIYRWRNSDWQILNNVDKENFKEYVDLKTLDTNHRSAGEIINFNNKFFEKGVLALNEDFKAVHGHDSADLINAYADVEQKIKSSNEGKGFVSIEAIPGDDKEQYAEATLKEMEQTIIRLLDMGVSMNDITILIRANKSIPVICEYFNNRKDEPKINVVSDEAFRLDFSATINTMVTALRYLADTDDTFALACVAFNYQKYVKKNYEIEEDINSLFLSSKEDILRLLPEEFTSRIKELTFLPLLELVEQLYKILELSNIENQDAYLFFFHDQMSSYCEDNKTDLHNFLNYWDEVLKSKTIPNGATDGVRIMSIHKSKGLEFHTVIMPFCDWDTKGKPSNLLWCEPKEEPYSELPLAPIPFTKPAINSIFSEDYQNEVLKNDVDNLNLIYVGFTRAVNNLIIFTKNEKKKEEKKSKSSSNEPDKIDSITKLIMRSIPDYMEEIEEEESGLHVWHTGTLEQSVDEEKKDNNIPAFFNYYDTLVDYRQSNNSSMFINDSSEDDEEGKLKKMEFIDRGLLYHKILEVMEQSDDIDSSIDKAIENVDTLGCFDSEKEKEDVRKHLHSAFTNSQARSWFDPKWVVRSECTILFKSKNGNVIERRPDRVISTPDKEETIVIDYKTGEEKQKEHGKQVSFYMNLLKKMGYRDVKGFVWYVLDDKIDEVK